MEDTDRFINDNSYFIDILFSGPPTPAPEFSRTVIFIGKVTYPGQDLFLRGGFSQLRPDCVSKMSSNCTIPITVIRIDYSYFKTPTLHFGYHLLKDVSLGDTDHYAKYNAWRKGDTSLDWNGAQENQGTFNNLRAEGTPMAWTSNKPSDWRYQSLNTYYKIFSFFFCYNNLNIDL